MDFIFCLPYYIYSIGKTFRSQKLMIFDRKRYINIGHVPDPSDCFTTYVMDNSPISNGILFYYLISHTQILTCRYVYTMCLGQEL
jgi:hypothetical protein